MIHFERRFKDSRRWHFRGRRGQTRWSVPVCEIFEKTNERIRFRSPYRDQGIDENDAVFSNDSVEPYQCDSTQRQAWNRLELEDENQPNEYAPPKKPEEI